MRQHFKRAMYNAFVCSYRVLQNEWLRKRIAELEKIMREHRERLRAQIDERNQRVRELTHTLTTKTIEHREVCDHNRDAEMELDR